MIHFHTEEIKFTLKNKTILKKWITSTILKRKHHVGEITFVFCSDDYLLKMNNQYLNHNTYTDVITFDYTEKSPLPSLKGVIHSTISGDIFISIDRVKENATKFSKSFEDELHRVIIHGVLHLMGYKDKSTLAKAEMTKQENLCLKQLKTAFPF
jgi:rRNA maturation RNase YbeY